MTIGRFDDNPDPENPGWHHFTSADPTLFNGAVMGKLITREEDGRCRLRMFPARHHLNVQGSLHGGTILALIDIALFATMHVLKIGDTRHSVTVELSNQFVGAGNQDHPLDALGEVVRETGSLLFLRGTVEQEERTIAAWSAIVRKISKK